MSDKEIIVGEECALVYGLGRNIRWLSGKSFCNTRSAMEYEIRMKTIVPKVKQVKLPPAASVANMIERIEKGSVRYFSWIHARSKTLFPFIPEAQRKIIYVVDMMYGLYEELSRGVLRMSTLEGLSGSIIDFIEPFDKENTPFELMDNFESELRILYYELLNIYETLARIMVGPNADTGVKLSIYTGHIKADARNYFHYLLDQFSTIQDFTYDLKNRDLTIDTFFKSEKTFNRFTFKKDVRSILELQRMPLMP